MRMTPIDCYLEQCSKKLIANDNHQMLALQAFQVLYHHLNQENKKRHSILLKMRKHKAIEGLYLWGGVGVGKTFLMDCFYECLPFKNKLRIHFHLFMQMIHEQLKINQGKVNPLDIVAKTIAKKYIVLCLDELIVADIADAIILAKLFQALFVNGVCLVTTSNIEPNELYKNGLQRQQFLPAIDLIKKHTQVLHISSSSDYRKNHEKFSEVFFTPHNQIALEKMENLFANLTKNQLIYDEPIKIYDRKIPVIKRTASAIWFDFDVICSAPRSHYDYLYLAKHFPIIFINKVPVISGYSNNSITLFIKLIDIFYDNKVKLILSTEAPIIEIYREGRMIKDFARTCSRLFEMQSESYMTVHSASKI